MTSSRTTALGEITINNEQLRRENDFLKANNDVLKDKITLLKAKQKDEMEQLTMLLVRYVDVNNENQIQQINS